MSRINPRTTILGGLRDHGPQDLLSLSAAWLNACGMRSPWRCPCCTIARHLCHLIRSRKVVRLGDGRYALAPSCETCGKGPARSLGGDVMLCAYHYALAAESEAEGSV